MEDSGDWFERQVGGNGMRVYLICWLRIAQAKSEPVPQTLIFLPRWRRPGRSPSELVPRLHPHVHRSSLSMAQKVGRNAPCPCGSGGKYKKCHGMNGKKTSGSQ